MDDSSEQMIQLCIMTCETVENAIMMLQMDRNTFNEFRAAVVGNPAIMCTHFPATVARWYSTSVLLGLRRLGDDHTKSDSLRKLLCRMIAKPSLWSLSHIIALYRSLPHPYSDESIEFFARSAYMDFSDASGEQLNLQKVTEDCEALNLQLETVKEIVDRTIAHHDRRGINTNLTFNELEHAIDKCEKIAIPYIGLLTGRSYDSLKPIDQQDWQKIFDPWRRLST